MSQLSLQQERKLKRLAKTLESGDVGLLTVIEEAENALETKLEALEAKFPTFRQPDDGKDGSDGRDGATGVAGTDGRDGKDGIDGKDGVNGLPGAKGERGLSGLNGLPGTDGKDGADGFIDVATVAYLEDKISSVEDEIKKQKKLLKPTFFGGVGGIKEIIAGANVTIDNSNAQYPVISAAAGGSSSVTTFETVSKNLNAVGATLNYTGGNLTSIVYLSGITKTLNYTGENLTSVVLSGTTPEEIALTKTLSYTGENLTEVSYGSFFPVL